MSKEMRILTISLNAWNNTQATGNTFSNFFESHDDDMVFSNIYCRNEPYDNNICTNYYRVTEADIINALKDRTHVCGKVIIEDDIVVIPKHRKQRKNSLKDWLMHKYRPAFLLFLREFIWMTNKWKTIELDCFLKKISPDVIYMHGHNNRYMHNLLWYCQKKTNAKVVVFWGDDMYGIKSYRPWQLLYHQWLRKKLRYTIEHADMLLGGSENLCMEYGKMFNRTFLPQYKICNDIQFPNIISREKELDVVYAGNLLYGRKELLVNVVRKLIKLNDKNQKKIRLHIYSASLINKKEQSILNDRCNCFFEGAKPYEEICEILNRCDVALFVESFDKDNIRQTRLSFSTKIIDYLQSSSALIVYGPREIASVQYLEKSDSAIVVHSDGELYEVLCKIQKEPCLLNEFARRKYNFALKNHSKSTLIPRIKTLV